MAALADRVIGEIEVAATPALRRVINATGVIINTNLGRAPLSQAARAAAAELALGYSNLEYDLVSGDRGSRQAHVAGLLCELTGAEAALVVNNNAAATLVILSALAAGREVIASRGELVEIGGGFRVPDVMRQGGARLVEVGTTNRTRVSDYAQAIGPDTALLLTVHPSNFRIVGFTEAPSREDLAELAHQRHVPMVDDLGSGCLLPTERWGLGHEPTPMESLAAGADVVCFSGDKLLGGPQAGIVVGRKQALQRIEQHPLMRAVRIDKLTLAALEATLKHYRDGTAEREIPVWRMICETPEHLRDRVDQWVRQLLAHGVTAVAMDGESAIGGGALPGATLPTVLCALRSPWPDVEIAELAAGLRRGSPPLATRVSRDQVLLDPRTVDPGDDDALLSMVARVFGHR